jgi:4-amino-4-deoxy-L-arabinose transferase-like glycosyltransferase
MIKLSYQSAVRYCLFAWIAIALALSGINASHALHSSYAYTHGWISAHFSVAARNFANFGIAASGGVPIVNNPPFGLTTEAYLHWPPLFHYALAAVYRVFGASEVVSHASMFVLLLANTLLLGLLVHRCWGLVAAQFAALTWLGCGAVGLYSHLVWNMHLMMTFLFLSLLGFVNAQSNWRWAVVGTFSFALAIASSWEAVFVCPGLLALSWWTRDRRGIRLAAIYALVALLVPAIILLNSAYHYPQQIAELWQRVMFRMGLAHDYVSTYETSSRREFALPSVFAVIWTIVGRHFEYVGTLPLAAVAWLLVSAVGSRREPRQAGGAVVLAGLTGMWWLWYVLFHSHVFIHDMQMVLAVPAAAVAAGVVGQSLIGLVDRLLPDNDWPRKMLVVIVVPLILLAPLAHATRDRDRFAPRGVEAQPVDPGFLGEVRLGMDLLRNTEPGSVVITTTDNSIPLFYSQRHLIQGVDSEQDFKSAIVFARKNFPGAPLYAAFAAAFAQQYLAAYGEGKRVGWSSGMILVRLPSHDGGQ